jgi:hypothetical protein
MDLARAIQLWLTRFLEPLAAAKDKYNRRQIFTAIGVDIAVDIEDLLEDIEPLLQSVASAIEALSKRDLGNLELTEFLDFLNDAKETSAALEKFAVRCSTVSPNTFDPVRLLSELTSLLVLRFLYAHSPAVVDAAALLTLIRPNESGRLPIITFDHVEKLISNPSELLSQYYLGSEGLRSLKTIEDADYAADRLFPRVASTLRHIGFGSVYARDPQFRLSDESGTLNRMLVVQIPLPTGIGAGLIVSLRSIEEGGAAAILAPFGTLSFSHYFDTWLVTVQAGTTVQGFLIESEGIQFSENEATPAFNIGFTAKKNKNNDEVAFRTSKSGTRFEVKQLQLSGKANFDKNVLDIDFLTEITSAAIVVNGGNGDGFLQKILPKDGIHIDFDLAIGWSNKKGLYFRGGAGLETTLPINKNLFDVLLINSVYLAILAKESGISLAVATSVTLKMGPVVVAIEQMGLKANFTFPERGGNLGPVNLEIGFKSPKGAGLVIDASAVVGAGFLEFDPDNAMYSGFVYLEIVKKISVTAVGLITTRMPDGSPGFSLLALVAVQFSPGIQLGYGFTLNGLGGLLGINRTVTVDVLRSGLRNGTLGSILFPSDPKKNIARIISDLKAVFPPAEGRFVFGPMVILGWGPNELIKLELGIILELPDPVRLLILGRLSLKLPDEKNPVVRLKLDSLGVIEFATGDVSLDAVLYDSEIKGFTITGEMALRANFGASPGFLLSVGGFHPAFKAPPGFPTLQRVAISLATGDNPRLRLAAYMAITTNTVQFGAALEIFAKKGEFSLEGQLSFDALIQFDPFGLAIGLGAMIAIKSGEQVLLCVKLEMNLTGPAPWHAWGEAQFRILLFDIKIPFEIKSGEEQFPELPTPVDLLPLMLKALKEPTNWSTQLPPGEHPLAVFREQVKGSGILVHPLALLQVSQRVAPLNEDIYKFGNATLKDGVQHFKLSVDGIDAQKSDYVQDWFAPAHFREMTDDEKIAADSFERRDAGIRFTQEGFSCGAAIIEDDMEYETGKAERTIKVASSKKTSKASVSKKRTAKSLENLQSYRLTNEFLEQVACLGAVGQSLLLKTGNARYQSNAAKSSVPIFNVKPRSYIVVGSDATTENRSNSMRRNSTDSDSKRTVENQETPVVESYTAAMELLKKKRSASPTTRAQLKIVPL